MATTIFYALTGESVNGGPAITYGFDNDGLLTRAGALTLGRSAINGLLTSTSLSSVNDGYTYDGYGQVATYTARYGNTVLYSYALTRDLLGRITRKTETIEGVTRTYEYGYDVRGRLADVSINGQFAEGYEYDANGNRTALVRPGSRISAYYDAQDRLLAYGDTQYTYTANGDLQTKSDASGTTTYAYDARGSLLRVDLPDGKLIEYLVDAAGRRIAKKVNGTIERKWLYRDSLKPIAELDASGDVVAVYGYAEKYTTPSFVEAGGKRYRVISDHLGSPRLVVNATDSADRPVRGAYAAFGEVSGSGLGWMPFGFAGGIYDEDTGLVRFGARDYDPVAGRWTAKDPSGFAGGENLYAYAYSNPVNFIDANGEEPITAAILIRIGIGVAVDVGCQWATKGWDNIDWSDVAISGAFGGLSGGAAAGLRVIKAGSTLMRFGVGGVVGADVGLSKHLLQNATNQLQGDASIVSGRSIVNASMFGALSCGISSSRGARK